MPKLPELLPRPLQIRRRFMADFASILVGLNGLYMVAGGLLSEIAARRDSGIEPALQDTRFLLGFGLLYLSVMLARRKLNAWRVGIAVYAIVLALGLIALARVHGHYGHALTLIQWLLVPGVVTFTLLTTREAFSVQSDIVAFRSSILVSGFVLLAALTYGVSGFLLLDQHDFHQELSLGSALHYTLDQFALVGQPLHEYTRRARLFTDSLSFVSVVALVYAVLSFFQPVRSRYRHRSRDRHAFARILEAAEAPSEDFFKLWPHDKQYYFNPTHTAGLAYRVQRGVALVQGDPVGTPGGVRKVLDDFDEICRHNDWLPAFIHVDNHLRKQYEARNYRLQRIGQEAVVDLAHFEAAVVGNKYFRNIRNRFEKAGYTAEVLVPPHSEATMTALRAVSDDWLSRPGREERGFAMGYFSEAYMQRCEVLVARDNDGVIQGFTNLVPAAFDTIEGTYDLLRQRTDSLSNCNDFMLMNLAAHYRKAGYRRLNLGLSPLVGLAEADKRDGLVGTVLSLAYTNGDRFYSFSGLHRFKDKYQPQWSDRYIVYRGSVASFSRVLNALLVLMKRTA